MSHNKIPFSNANMFIILQLFGLNFSTLTDCLRLNSYEKLNKNRSAKEIFSQLAELELFPTMGNKRSSSISAAEGSCSNIIFLGNAQQTPYLVKGNKRGDGNREG